MTTMHPEIIKQTEGVLRRADIDNVTTVHIPSEFVEAMCENLGITGNYNIGWTYGDKRYWHRDDALQVALIANHVFS